jgi:hypothetical protein
MDYIPYGEEWIKEMNKLPKDAILRMFSKMGIEKNQELKQVQSSLKEKEKECEELKAWKESMLNVMPPIQEIGQVINVKLGESIHDKILPFIEELKAENERLKNLVEEINERENNPYWYWPQCDVDECKGVSCNGGGCWRETGYWSVCTKHSTEFREGKPQPKMKQSAIDRESRRDKYGYLPSVESE